HQHAEYTGPEGSTGNDSRVIAASGAEYRAITMRRLSPYEGFTVAVAWQKGIVTAPGESEKLGWWLSDNAGILALLAGLIVTGLYYVYAWNRVGRDPPRGTIIPLFSPPPGLTPAGARFIWKQRFDDKAFASALVGLAVKGGLRIGDDHGGFAVTKRSIGSGGTPLARADRALYNAIPEGTTALKSTNHAIVSRLRSTLEGVLDGEYEGSVFLRNIGWFWKGLAVSFVCLVIAALLLPAEDAMTGLVAIGWMSIWWGVILTVAWASLKSGFSQRGAVKKIGALFKLMFLIPFAAGGVAAPVLMISEAGSPRLYMLVGAAMLLGIINLVFFHLLRAPTVAGRKLLDQLEGFRMYMTTVEEDRLKVLHPPEKTPELFERYLPYALALDCENAWNKKFAAVLAAAAAAGATAPMWYS
ncbi:MAG: DUF2207 domain-containing protein, partial [Methylocella sp.]